jgi:putative tricarboxylic transport membrane protein
VKRIDIVAALVLLALSAAVAYFTADLPYWTAFAPGPAFASFWTAGAGAAIGIALLFQALTSHDDEPAGWPDGVGARHVLWGTAVLWLLFVMLPWLGTVIGGLIFMLLFLLFIGKRPILQSVFASVLTVGIIEAVFVLWLNIDLPEGVFGF